MKRLMQMLLLVAATEAAFAKPKPAPKPEAKEAKASDIKTAPATPVTAKKQNGKLALALWGGYNISQRTDLQTAVEAYGNNALGLVSSGFETSKNGLSAGLDAWYRFAEKLDVGLGAGFVRGFTIERTARFSQGNVVNKTTMNYLPILLQARYFVTEGLYAGGGAGVAIGLGNKSEVTTTTPTGLISSVPYTDSYSTIGIWLEAQVGYQLEVMDNVYLDAFGKFSYQIRSVTFNDLDSSAALSSSSVKNTGFFITPGLSVSMKF